LLYCVSQNKTKKSKEKQSHQLVGGKSGDDGKSRSRGKEEKGIIISIISHHPREEKKKEVDIFK
jgi:hypothetical protein